MCKKIIEYGFHAKEWKKAVAEKKQIAEMGSDELLQNRTRKNNIILETILFSTWHPKLNAIPSILKNIVHSISNNLKLSKYF